jgi:hypothetical protein
LAGDQRERPFFQRILRSINQVIVRDHLLGRGHIVLLKGGTGRAHRHRDLPAHVEQIGVESMQLVVVRYAEHGSSFRYAHRTVCCSIVYQAARRGT